MNCTRHDLFSIFGPQHCFKSGCMKVALCCYCKETTRNRRPESSNCTTSWCGRCEFVFSHRRVTVCDSSLPGVTRTALRTDVADRLEHISRLRLRYRRNFCKGVGNAICYLWLSPTVEEATLHQTAGFSTGHAARKMGVGEDLVGWTSSFM